MVKGEFIHVSQETNRRTIPLHLLAHIVGPSQFIVCCVKYSDIINAYSDCGVKIISIKRNLRDVLVSMYRFKIAKVAPVDEKDFLWRVLPDSRRFLGFLEYAAERDVSLSKKYG